MTAAVVPGSIPGLLRRGSPVVLADTGVNTAGRLGVVVDRAASESYAVVALESTARFDAALEWLPVASLALDLSDPTGRAHAAWWLAEQDEDDVDAAILEHVLGGDWHELPMVVRERWLALWSSGRDLTDAQVEALRLVVIAVAEVSR